MSLVMNWIKNYPITLVSIFVVALSLGWLAWLQVSGATFTDQVKKRESKMGQIASLAVTPVTIPPKEADGPEIQRTIAVNRAAIDTLTTAYTEMGSEADTVFKLAIDFNEQRHLPILDRLFPSTDDQALPYEAKIAYLEAFQEMLQPYEENSLLPRLNAGGPVRSAALQQRVAQEEQNFLSQSLMIRSVSDLAPVDRENLRRKKRDALIAELKNSAERIHIYADRDPKSNGYPFDVAGWATASGPPSFPQMWEGQLALWVQQDIVEAIARTNQVHDVKRNIMNSPIKRLLGITVHEGYVGITTGGALTGGSGAGAGDAKEADEKMPDDFSVAPTGRRSNAIYDVKHATIEMIIDFQSMAEFLDALSRVNFMSVLQINFEQVDEYAALQSGYIYGNGDSVRVEIIVESLWLRSWTKRFMPDPVKERIGIPVETEETEEAS